MCRWFPEQKTNGTVSYIFVSSIANVFCVSLRIWLCIYGITLRVSLYDVKIAWIERRLASPHLLFSAKELFLHYGSIFVAEGTGKNPFCKKGTERGSKTLRIRAPCGGSKPPPYHRNSISCVGNGQCPFRNSQQILRREQNSPNSGTLLSASQTFPLTGESPRPTLQNVFRA